jgi:hypothetical protein
VSLGNFPELLAKIIDFNLAPIMFCMLPEVSPIFFEGLLKFILADALTHDLDAIFQFR